MGIIESAAILLLSAIGGWFGGFFGSYLKKKGENVATHEDINKLVDQVKAVTTTTKEIEAKIDDQMWNKQRQWDMKRDILLEFGRLLKDFEQAELKLSIAVKSLREAEPDKKADHTKRRDYALNEYEKASALYERATFPTSLVVDQKTQEEIFKISRIIRDIIGNTLSGKDVDAYLKRNQEIAVQYLVVAAEIRRELGLPARPLSSGSSAAPIPGSQAPE